MNALCDKLYCCLITKFISYQTGFKLVQIYLNCFTCFWAVNWIYILQAWSRCRVCPFASRFQNSHWYFRNKEDSPWFDHLSHHAKLAEIINMVGKYMNKPFSNLSKSDLSNCKFGFHFNCEEVDLQLNYMNITDFLKSGNNCCRGFALNMKHAHNENLWHKSLKGKQFLQNLSFY